MRKWFLSGFARLLAAVILTSCAENDVTGIQESSGPSPNSAPVQKEPPEFFKAGVFVNVEDSSEPLLNQEIKS
ncbi:hypothetical protein G5B47_21655 [Paenibacillus sp. 7124]|uniref:Uncharacterized protein n=1 Tax=Paenibacillus apii TaxID=1850370 RepID=A0A6M1PP29_9BACL|nr:hypothetical protein [Paenibacillus apii]NGM85010.1 hypothetical protein [Paenibacillus apii]NJJ38530.1 hypothetical protein [Paenibacillus apii]